MNRAFLAFLAPALLAGAAVAAERSQMGKDDTAAEHQRIEAERHAAEARFDERRRDCEARFVVTSCMEEAKRERREALSRLRREENALNDRERKARAAERRDEIRAGEAEQARRAAEARSAATKQDVAPRTSSDRPGTLGRERAASDSTPRRASPPEDRLPRLGRLGPERSAEEEARSRATFDAAQRSAAAHRAEVEARNARRAAEHKPSPPLPLPPEASSP